MIIQPRFYFWVNCLLIQNTKASHFLILAPVLLHWRRPKLQSSLETLEHLLNKRKHGINDGTFQHKDIASISRTTKFNLVFISKSLWIKASTKWMNVKVLHKQSLFCQCTQVGVNYGQQEVSDTMFYCLLNSLNLRDSLEILIYVINIEFCKAKKNVYNFSKIWGQQDVFERSLLCSPRLHVINKKYSNIVKYFNLK